MAITGIIFALIALLSWGFGDFSIQRASRKVGVIRALFYITILASVVYIPFIWRQIFALNLHQIILLFVAGLVILLVALLEFQAFKIGKLSVVEPIMSLELPLTVIIAAMAGHEHLIWYEYIIIFFVFLGIFMTVTPHKETFHHIKRLEKGTLLAVLSTVGMALFNFLMGLSSQQTSPLIAQWGTSLVMAVFCFVYMLATNDFKNIRSDFRRAPREIFAEMFLDNIAWTAYAFAVVFIPISIAITVSESYIILAVILGIILNKERLKNHQYFGVVLAIVSVLVLTFLNG